MSENKKIARLIAMGKWRYILLYGMLAWGVTTAALFTAWMWYTKGTPRLTEVVAAFVMFPLGGIAWGTCCGGPSAR